MKTKLPTCSGRTASRLVASLLEAPTTSSLEAILLEVADCHGVRIRTRDGRTRASGPLRSRALLRLLMRHERLMTAAMMRVRPECGSEHFVCWPVDQYLTEPE